MGSIHTRPQLTCLRAVMGVEMIAALTLIDGLGIIGSLMICGGYLAVSNAWINAERTAYQVLNLVGSALLLISLYFRPNPGAILIEVLWAAIAIMSLARIWWRARR
jgi:hypothetical protein